LPFTYYFGGNGKGAQVDLDNLLPNRDLHDNRVDDGALFFGGQGRPAIVQIAGLGQQLVSAEVLDLEEVELALEPGQFVFQPLEAFFERLVRPAESVGRDLVTEVEPVGLVHLRPDLRGLRLQGDQPFFLGLDLLVSLTQMPGHVFGREEEVLELLVEDGLDVGDADLVPALPADVLAALIAGVHVHHAAAVAVGNAGKEVERFGAGLAKFLSLLVQDGHALGPDLLRYDRLDR